MTKVSRVSLRFFKCPALIKQSDQIYFLWLSNHIAKCNEIWSHYTLIWDKTFDGVPMTMSGLSAKTLNMSILSSSTATSTNLTSLEQFEVMAFTFTAIWRHSSRLKTQNGIFKTLKSHSVSTQVSVFTTRAIFNQVGLKTQAVLKSLDFTSPRSEKNRPDALLSGASFRVDDFLNGRNGEGPCFSRSGASTGQKVFALL